MRPSILLLTALLLVRSGEVAAQDAQVLGRQVTLRLRAGQESQVVGELLAVHRDSIWVMSKGSIVPVPMPAVAKATFPRHGFAPWKGLVWGVGAGLISGGALAAACNSESGDCGAVIPVSAAFGLLFGGLAALSLSSSYQWRFEPPVADSLRRFARFPQGLPPGGLEPVPRAPPDSPRDP